jgi:hypothetical protein
MKKPGRRTYAGLARRAVAMNTLPESKFLEKFDGLLKPNGLWPEEFEPVGANLQIPYQAQAL